MMMKNEEISNEIELINGFVFDEMKKTVPTTDTILSNFFDYIDYLNERYKHREAANRPDWVTEYINIPDKWL